MVRCLLIENDAHERQKLATMVQGFGCMCEALGAEQAAALLMSRAPDFILMEARDDSASREVLRLVQYRSETGKGPVVILYAERPSLDDVGLSILSGAADFLVKPFDSELLQFKLEQAGLLHRPAA
jgi:two-component system, chemotaxis family, chemotaxis protein CheY